MKIRNGFVSNSSSSSFCIVGVDINDWKMEKRHQSIKDLREKILPEGKDLWDLGLESWGGETPLGDNLFAHGSDGDVYYLGIPLVDFFKKGLTFEELTEICRKTIKEKYGIDVPEAEFDVFFGEGSSG